MTYLNNKIINFSDYAIEPKPIENNDYQMAGWKTAEKFSIVAFQNKMEAERLRSENSSLKKRLDELQAEIQRLSQIAQY